MQNQEIHAFGHPNIQATHPTTLMFTKDTHLSKNGDCIVAVAADRALADMCEAFKEELRKPGAKLTIVIEAGGSKMLISAAGSPKLPLTNPTEAVVRKSNYISDRTLAVCADKASLDLPRSFVEKLKDTNQKVKITLIAQA